MTTTPRPPGDTSAPEPDRATFELLHAVLERRADDGPSVDEALGMVTALVIGPGLTMPSVWMGWLLGEEPTLDSSEEIRSFTGALFTIWNHVAALEEPDEFRRLLERVEELPGEPRVERFCAGFVQAVESDQEPWNEQVVRELLEAAEEPEEDFADDPARAISSSSSLTARFLMPILILAGREAPDREVLGIEIPDDDASALDEGLRTALPDCLAALARHLRLQRVRDAREYQDERLDGYPRPVRRTEPKVGRNDPCPCGSGKKFKRCCGR